MNKQQTGIIIAIVALLLIGVGIIWVIMSQNQQQAADQSTAPSADSSETDTTPPENTTLPADPEQVSNDPNNLHFTVTIKDFAFQENTIKVKKGTKVTWVNEDNVGHNVLSKSDAPAGGPPKSAPTFSQGESFDFTFNTVGKYEYYCGPHPNMTGTVEVIE